MYNLNRCIFFMLGIKNGSLCVVGLWHLGCITSSCMASLGVNVVAFDENEETVNNLRNSVTPIDEPGLDNLIKQGVDSNLLKFSSDTNDLKDHVYYWVTYDTPVDYEDKANSEYVVNKIENLIKYIKESSILIISSQLPVGSINHLKYLARENHKKNLKIYYLPENLRLGKSIDIFLKPDRIVVGSDYEDNKQIKNLLNLISSDQVWMSNTSAEISKHAINSFLATSVVFANEIASICEKNKASADDVSKALKSDVRIGKRAYLSAGGPFAGGTLARDLVYLNNFARENNLKLPLLASITNSNNMHKEWVLRAIHNDFNKLNNLNILILGLSYKSGTNTLRRSHSIEIAEWLIKKRNNVYLFDPVIQNLDKNINEKFFLLRDIEDVCVDFDVIISTKNWNNQIDDIKSLIERNKEEIYLYDVSRNLSSKIKQFICKKLKYRAIGL